MSNQASSSQFRSLFKTALRGYEKQTGIELFNHPLSECLSKCHSAESVIAVLQEQAQTVIALQGSDGDVMMSLQSAIHVLHSPFILGDSECLGLVCLHI